MAPGYEIGPLGVAVMKHNYSSTGRGQPSPPKNATPVPSVPSAAFAGVVSPRQPVDGKSDVVGDEPKVPLPDGGGGSGAVPLRGSGLRDLLGNEANGAKERERSRLQAETLQKQVEENKVRRMRQ